MNKKKIYIVLIVVFTIIFFYWQKEKADNNALSIKELQFQSAIGSAAEDLSNYYETKNEHNYLFGISSLKAASWVLNWFPKDSKAYRAMDDLLSLHAHMVVTPDVVELYLPEMIKYFRRLEKNIDDTAAYDQMLILNNKIKAEIYMRTNK